MRAAYPDAEARWLATLQGIVGRAAHELKGALNGTSVNLEVVRSRVARSDAALPGIDRYVEAAREQFDEVITMSEALLSLGRPLREPVELAPVVRRMSALLVRAAKADGRLLEVGGAFEELGVTSAGGNAVRVAIGGALLAAIDASARTRCEPMTRLDLPTIRIESCDGSLIPCDAGLVAVAAGSDIRIQAERSAISISFPR